MRYVSLDIETTSLEPDPAHVLMLSAVIEDTQAQAPLESLPHFTAFLQKQVYYGQAAALAMNAWIFQILAEHTNSKYPLYAEDSFWVYFGDFLYTYFGREKIVAAGKNVGTFDLRFLPQHIQRYFHRRTLDPGTLFTNFATDTEPPSLSECMRRARIEKSVTHDAYEDALGVIRIFRTYIERSKHGV